MTKPQEDLRRLIDGVIENNPNSSTITDVMQMTEILVSTIKDWTVETHHDLYSELHGISNFIEDAKKEMSTLKGNEMQLNRIPEAGEELDAVVIATEQATDTIMSAAEEMMGADPSDSDAYSALINDKTIEIFEACSFQDITGQRIAKVVSTLNYIDKQITSIVERLDPNSSSERPKLDLDAKEETPEERRARELILNGPQMEGKGVQQDDIDALFD